MKGEAEKVENAPANGGESSSAPAAAAPVPAAAAANGKEKEKKDKEGPCGLPSKCVIL